jgi:hypothetical protein
MGAVLRRRKRQKGRGNEKAVRGFFICDGCFPPEARLASFI